MRFSKVFSFPPTVKRCAFLLLFWGMGCVVFHDYFCNQHPVGSGKTVVCEMVPVQQSGEGKNLHESFHAPCSITLAEMAEQRMERSFSGKTDHLVSGMEIPVPLLKPPIA